MRWAIAAMLVLLLGGPAAAGSGEPALAGGWAGETLPGMRMSAAYLQLSNPGPASLTLVGVSSPRAQAITLHETRIDAGMARMVPVESITIAPGEQLLMEPGGLHLMIELGDSALVAGETLPLTLHFTGVEPVQAVLPVRRMSGAADSHHHHHQHGP